MDSEHTTNDKDRFYGSNEKLSADLLKDIPFDAITLGVMKVEGETSTDEKQRAEGSGVNRWQTGMRYCRRTSAWQLRNNGRRGRAIWNKIY